MDLCGLFRRDLAFSCRLLWLSAILISPTLGLRAHVENRAPIPQAAIDTLDQSVPNATQTTEPPPPRTVFIQAVTTQGVYEWNKWRYTPQQYQWTFCSRWCNGTSIVTDTRYKCANVKCIECFCRRPACELYGLCCPDYETNTGLRSTRDSGNGNGDISNSKNASKIECGFSYKGYYLHVHSCPDHYDDLYVKNLCEADSDPREGVTEETITRVSDTVDGVVYHNKYCAICNNAKEMIPWRVELACQHYMYVYNATSMDQLLSNSLMAGSNCSIDQFPMPLEFKPQICKIPPHYNYEPEGTCNATGLWKAYDEDVVTACREFQQRHFSVFHHSNLNTVLRRGRYKNIFCALCNMKAFPKYGDCSSDTGGTAHTVPIRKTPPFSVLLGFRRDSAMQSPPLFISSFVFTECLEGQWSSPDGRCLPLLCSPGKSLHNGACSTAMDQIRGLGYNLNLLFYNDLNGSNVDIPQNIEDPPTFENIHSSFLVKVMVTLAPLAESYDLNFGAALLQQGPGGQDVLTSDNGKLDVPAVLWVQGYVATRKDIPRDDAETQIIDGLTKSNVTLQYLDLTMQMNWNQKDVSDLCLRQDVDCSLKRERYVRLFSKIFNHTTSFLSVSNILRCPCVQFSTNAYQIETFSDDNSLPRTTVTLTIGKTSLVFSETNEMNDLYLDPHNVLSVCKDALDSKLNSIDEERRREFYSRNFRAEADDITQAQYYMTLGCVGASMACLALALMTYFRFRVLRTSAGWNNIFLCGSLLTAQASLLASAHVSGPQTACTALGMLTHFLWLWMFTWSFICCFHMFRVFTSKTRQEKSRQAQKSSFFGTVALSFLIPAAIVCTVITASHITSGGDRTGYGHESCYLDSTLLIGIATALPLALVTLSNIVFFSVTVVKIKDIKKMQSRDFLKNEDHRNLYVYVKLSTMTGIFWLIQLLAEATDLDGLRFVAILTNGLQGVFIFVSYICNKRVLNFYLNALGFKSVTLSDSQRKTNRSVVEGNAPPGQHAADPSPENNMAASSKDGKSSIASIEQIAAELSKDESIHRKSVVSSGSSGVHSADDGDAEDGSRKPSVASNENVSG